MDVLYFLRERTRFIEYYFETAGAPFLELKRKMEAEEPPFDEHPDPESGEPAFQDEYDWASKGEEAVGRVAVSLLAALLHQTFEHWRKELGITFDEADLKYMKRKGWYRGYQRGLEGLLGERFNDSPADLKVVEQVVIARNSDQHSGSLTDIGAHLPADVRKRFGKPLYVSENSAMDELLEKVFGSRLVVTRETLMKGIEEVEKLVAWLIPRMDDLCYGRRKPANYSPGKS